jgi:tRNA(fMet)-specific endonuclease VapC
MMLLDTDTCIGLLRGRPNVLERRKQADEEVAISFMTVAELYFGAEKSSDPAGNRRLVDQFVLSIRVIHTNTAILRHFGRIKATLHRQGVALTDADVLIAASCLDGCSRLITGNVRHYERIEGLRLENWLR